MSTGAIATSTGATSSPTGETIAPVGATLMSVGCVLCVEEEEEVLKIRKRVGGQVWRGEKGPFFLLLSLSFPTSAHLNVDSLGLYESADGPDVDQGGLELLKEVQKLREGKRKRDGGQVGRREKAFFPGKKHQLTWTFTPCGFTCAPIGCTKMRLGVIVIGLASTVRPVRPS